MKRHTSTKSLWLLLGLALAAAAFALFDFTPRRALAIQTAQPSATPQRFQVTTTHVKPEMVDEYEAHLKNESLPLFKKAGGKQWSTWRTANLGESFEYVVVRPLASVAEFDEPNYVVKVLGEAGARAWIAKWRRMIASRHTFTVQALPELSIPPKTNDAPKLAVVYRTKIAPFRRQEYEEHFKTYSLPQFRKTDQQAFLMSRITFGGDSYEYIGMFLVDSFTGISKWLSSFANAGSGPGAKLAGIVVQQESAVYRYVPELSIRPEAMKAANK